MRQLVAAAPTGAAAEPLTESGATGSSNAAHVQNGNDYRLAIDVLLIAAGMRDSEKLGKRKPPASDAIDGDGDSKPRKMALETWRSKDGSGDMHHRRQIANLVSD